MKMKMFSKQLLLLVFCFLMFTGNGMAEIRVAYPDRAAVNQEIYNWLDVQNESVTQILYYVDGVLWWGNTASNNRWLFPDKYPVAGSHKYEIYVSRTDGTLWYKQWVTTIYNPTKSLAGAITYADNFAIWPNVPAYWFFLSDCTNFVSQILHDGGGFPETTTGTNMWYYNGRFDYSNSWTVVNDFYNAMIGQGIVDVISPEGWTVTIGNEKTFIYPPVLNGHPIKYKWLENTPATLHNAFVVTAGTGEDGRLQPLIDAHTTNRYHTDWRLLNERGSSWVSTSATNYRVKWDY